MSNPEHNHPVLCSCIHIQQAEVPLYSQTLLEDALIALTPVIKVLRQIKRQVRFSSSMLSLIYENLHHAYRDFWSPEVVSNNLWPMTLQKYTWHLCKTVSPGTCDFYCHFAQKRLWVQAQHRDGITHHCCVPHYPSNVDNVGLRYLKAQHRVWDSAENQRPRDQHRISKGFIIGPERVSGCTRLCMEEVWFPIPPP